MRIPRIHTQQHLETGLTLELEEGPSRHLIKALRLGVDAPLILFNGAGGEYQAIISACTKKYATVLVGDYCDQNRQSPLNIELGIGISRGERFELVIQKATELGANKIVPLFTERCEVKLNQERLQKKLTQWQHIAISACEQCQRNIVLEVGEPQHLDTWLENTKADGKWVLHHRSEKKLTDYAQPTSAALLIGPEGGLNEREIEQAQANGFAPLTLGPRVMRTETAPIACISIMQALWGDLI